MRIIKRRRHPPQAPAAQETVPTAESKAADVRAWAKAKGIQCPASGRIPKNVLMKYRERFLVRSDTGWIISETYTLAIGRRTYVLDKDTPLKVKGEQGVYRFKRHVINPGKLDPETGNPVEWIDVIGGVEKGRPSIDWTMFRAFRPGQIRAVLKKRPPKKEAISSE